MAVIGTTLLYLLARGPGHALVERVGPRVGLTKARLERALGIIERRGRPALAIGRGTPGLRTVTTVAAGGSGVPLRRALPALILGSSVFLQLHLVLGYALGPTARDAIDEAKGPAIAVFLLVVLAGAVFWFVRKRRPAAAAEAWTEATCPACMAVSFVGERLLRA